MDDSGARFTNANFQEVPSHSSASSKDGGSSERESKNSDGKSKKSSSHSSSSSSSGSRGRKSNPSKSHGPVVTIATSSTVPSSTSPFQQGEAQWNNSLTKCHSWLCTRRIVFADLWWASNINENYGCDIYFIRSTILIQARASLSSHTRLTSL